MASGKRITIPVPAIDSHPRNLKARGAFVAASTLGGAYIGGYPGAVIGGIGSFLLAKNYDDIGTEGNYSVQAAAAIRKLLRGVRSQHLLVDERYSESRRYTNNDK